MNRIAPLTLALFIAAGITACSKQEETPKANLTQAKGQNHARVLQVVPAGAYTYVEAMGETGEKIWMAGATMDIKVGDNISFGQYSLMSNYASKTLGRTFERILFVESWSTGDNKVAAVANHGVAPPGGMGALPGGHPPMTGVPGGHPPMGGGLPMGAPGGQNNGVVKSSTTTGGYTYVEVQQGNGTMWVAAPETQLKAGDKITWDGGAVMNNFTAKSLNRTFDKIVFAGGIAVVK